MDDEIWRPGYDGPAPVSGAASFDRVASPQSPPRASDRRPWRLVAVATAVGATALVAVVVVVVDSLSSRVQPEGVAEVVPPIDVDDDRLKFSSSEGADFVDGEPLRLLDDPAAPFAGADARRLPTDLLPRWTIELGTLVADGGANSQTWVEVVDRRYVVVGTGDARRFAGPAAVSVLDASSGERLWSTQVDARIDLVEFVAAIDDSLVLTIGTEILALDAPTGSELWAGRLAKTEAGPEQMSSLPGTDLLAVTSPSPGASVRLLDPTTGATVGEMIGEVLGTDDRGLWYVLRGAKLMKFDLAPQNAEPPSAEPPNGSDSIPTIDSELVGTIDSEQSRVAAVIGGSLVAMVDEKLAVGPLDADGERITGPNGMTPLTIDSGTPAALPPVGGIIALGGSAFAAVGSGTLTGAEVVDGSIRFAWQRRGAVSASFATERGVMLLIGTEGGSAQTLIDGATGEPIATLTMSPGFFDALDVVGNGIVTRRTSGDGVRIAGLDLDGNELWALDGSTPVSVGDGVVVRSTPQADGSFEVVAYGDRG